MEEEITESHYLDPEFVESLLDDDDEQENELLRIESELE